MRARRHPQGSSPEPRATRGCAQRKRAWRLSRPLVLVGLSSGETIPAANSNYPCCTHRGGVVAIDIATGKILWKTYTIAEEPRQRGTNAEGVALWGPAGGSVWNSPTIDPKRRLVYVGTGNGFTEPAAPTTDSIMALDMDTGRIVWHHQEFAGDAFIGGCGKTNAPGGNCPQKLGPDWDFGGASMILHHLPDGHDLVIGAGKGGVAVAVDPDRQGAVVWRRVLYKGAPPNAGGLVVFGGAADGSNAYYPLQQAGGGLAAVRLSDGQLLWTADLDAGPRGQASAASAIPGVIFTGGWDGILRAVSDHGALLWSYDTRHEYQTINGVAGKGGSLGAPGAVLADGMLYVASGYIGPGGGTPGNVLIAMAPKKN